MQVTCTRRVLHSERWLRSATRATSRSRPNGAQPSRITRQRAVPQLFTNRCSKALLIGLAHRSFQSNPVGANSSRIQFAARDKSLHDHRSRTSRFPEHTRTRQRAGLSRLQQDDQSTSRGQVPRRLRAPHPMHHDDRDRRSTHSSATVGKRDHWRTARRGADARSCSCWLTNLPLLFQDRRRAADLSINQFAGARMIELIRNTPASP